MQASLPLNGMERHWSRQDSNEMNESLTLGRCLCPFRLAVYGVVVSFSNVGGSRLPIYAEGLHHTDTRHMYMEMPLGVLWGPCWAIHGA